MPSSYKYYRLFMRMLDGDDIAEDFSWYLDMDGEQGVSLFRSILFSSIEKKGASVTDRISVGTLKQINDVVKIKLDPGAHVTP